MMGSKLNVVANEPVLVVAVAAVITWLGAYLGVKVDPKVATEAAGTVLLIGSAYARQLVTPTAKQPPPVEPPPTEGSAAAGNTVYKR